jgi:two-component system, NarL family, response regulator DevR
MSNQSNVFLLCENRLLREALLRILGKRNDLSMVGACGYSASALSGVMASQPRVVVLDSLRLALGPPLLLRHIQTSLPNSRTVMIGMDSREEDFLSAVREGVAGYLLREASAAEVSNALHAVALGESVCPPCFMAKLFHHAAQHLALRQNLQARNPSQLSRREQQLLTLLCAGLTNKEIANQLHLSEHTVKNHVHRILRKTGTADRVELIDLYRSPGELRSTGNESSALSATA